eukprot:scaffold4198_cov69-Phaeocystis_antarctica.AAC.3
MRVQHGVEVRPWVARPAHVHIREQHVQARAQQCGDLGPAACLRVEAHRLADGAEDTVAGTSYR